MQAEIISVTSPVLSRKSRYPCDSSQMRLGARGMPGRQPAGIRLAADRRMPANVADHAIADVGGAAPPLRSYLRFVAKCPTLSRAEEESLARQVHDGKNAPGALRRLITAHLRTVVEVVRPFIPFYRGGAFELIQEGNLALLHAVRRFVPESPVTLRAYAASWIRTYVARFLEAQGGAVSPSGDEIREEAARRQRERRRNPAAGLDPELDASVEASRLGERLVRVLPAFEAELDGREREIFRARVLGEPSSTLKTLAAVMGISAERVRQIERELRAGLRARLASDLDAVDRADWSSDPASPAPSAPARRGRRPRLPSGDRERSTAAARATRSLTAEVAISPA